MITRWERIEGGLVGLLVGDALGVPYEFHAAQDLPPVPALELEPPPGFRRSHPSAPPGTWSDDGAQALCLLDSLLERGQLELPDLAERLVRWYHDGYLAVDQVVFDVGVQTRNALKAIARGVSLEEAAPAREGANGNGSMMRVLPLALWHRGSDAELVRDARTQSLVTHGHLRSQLCCALYCLWARAFLDGSSDPWTDAVARLRVVVAGEAAAQQELDLHIRPEDPPGGTGGGYVVDCLRSARLALAAGGYEAVVKAAVALGNDTDTTAAVAGGIAGVRDGLAAIPARWRDRLRGQELLQPLVARLRAVMG